MGKFIDRTGERFGKLVVVKRLPNDANQQAMWLCHCDCGTDKPYRASNLRSRTSMSCGCSHLKNPLEWLYNRLKSQSEHRRLEFRLTYQEFLEFANITNCHYCGSPVVWERNPIRKRPYSQKYNLDRIDNEKGYEKENCVVCCTVCNYMKGQLSETAFLTQCQRIVNHQT